MVPYPRDCAPSQHLKFEQYYGYFSRSGMEVTESPFVCPALWRVLYQHGHFLKKTILTLYGYLRRIRDFLRARRFDAVYLHLWAVPFGPPWFEEFMARRGVRIIYDIDDLVYLSKASHANPFVPRFRKEERIKRIMKVASHVVTSTQYLRRFALSQNTNVTYISSTIDTDLYYARKHSQTTRGVTLGWSGSHSTAPYLHLIAPVIRLLRISDKP